MAADLFTEWRYVGGSTLLGSAGRGLRMLATTRKLIRRDDDNSSATQRSVMGQHCSRAEHVALFMIRRL